VEPIAIERVDPPTMSPNTDNELPNRDRAAELILPDEIESPRFETSAPTLREPPIVANAPSVEIPATLRVDPIINLPPTDASLARTAPADTEQPLDLSVPETVVLDIRGAVRSPSTLPSFIARTGPMTDIIDPIMRLPRIVTVALADARL
jgi:hypothetical protein